MFKKFVIALVAVYGTAEALKLTTAEEDDSFDCIAEDADQEQGMFLKWMNKFGKNYPNMKTWKKKKGNWIRNNGTIKMQNQLAKRSGREDPAMFDHNELSDKSEEELAKKLGLKGWDWEITYSYDTYVTDFYSGDYYFTGDDDGSSYIDYYSDGDGYSSYTYYSYSYDSDSDSYFDYLWGGDYEPTYYYSYEDDSDYYSGSDYSYNYNDGSGGGWWDNFNWDWLDNDTGGDDYSDGTDYSGGDDVSVGTDHSGDYYFTGGDDYGESLTFDWRSATAPVTDQGDCGSCWAVSGNTVLGAQKYIDEGSSGTKEEFSTALPVRCAESSYPDYLFGCDGGDALRMFKWYMRHGTTSESNYPYSRSLYNGIQGYCDIDMDTLDQGVVKNAGAAMDYDSMKTVMAKGPTVGSFSINSKIFSFYSHGVIQAGDSNCYSLGTDPNHQMAVVALDTTGSQPYWLIQNSWGTDWGEGGFAKFAVDEGNGYGTCSMYIDGLQWVETQ